MGAGGAAGPLLLPDCGWWQRLVAEVGGRLCRERGRGGAVRHLCR